MRYFLLAFCAAYVVSAAMIIIAICRANKPD